MYTYEPTIIKLIKKLLKIKSPSNQYMPRTLINIDEILKKYDEVVPVQEQLKEQI